MKIKGFNKCLCCRGMQFEIGKEYKIEHDEPIRLCSNTVFHYCDSLEQVHSFYSVTDANRYCEIEVLGDEVTDGNKCGSDHIKIIREITGEELEKLKRPNPNNEGVFNTGNWNTGDCNTGNRNAGDWNAGDWNTGDWNTGDCNTGNRNTGDWNTGNRNAGDWNTGDWNLCDYSNGVFNTKEDTSIRIFNTPSGMSLREFRDSEYYRALISAPFILTEWVEYTDEEKAEDHVKALLGGYLKSYTYEEACANWWDKLTDEAKETIQDIPNFDIDIFETITGIEI